MRFSCNGCRVLRKGCSENCSIRPCLEWIKSPEAQANATLFLAKFYGRAGLVNLVDSGPQHLRPSIFKSLLQEACGRIVNPIYGSTGLISTGNWHLCEAAVQAVLSGSPITQIPTVENVTPVFKACDIRHVPKKDKESPKVKNQTRFKKSKPKSRDARPAESSGGDSGASQSRGSESGSVETVEDTLAKPINIGMDLTLGFQSFQKSEIVDDELMPNFELTLALPPLC